MLELTFSSKLDWGSYIIFIAKTASKKIGALIRSMKFLSPEVALYLCKSTPYAHVYGILLSGLGWCPQFLLGFVRQARKMDMLMLSSDLCCKVTRKSQHPRLLHKLIYSFLKYIEHCSIISSSNFLVAIINNKLKSWTLGLASFLKDIIKPYNCHC